MRYLLTILILFSLSLAKETITEAKIPEDVIKALGIKTVILKEKKLDITEKYPSIVKDDLTLSEAIYSPVKGLIKKLLVKEGDKVRKGQALAYVYSPEILSLITDIQQYKEIVKNYKDFYENEKKLYLKKVISYSRYFNAKIQYQNALAKLKAMKKKLLAFGEIKDGLLVLKSHMEGYIAKQNVVLGESVSLDKRIFKIHSHKKLWTIAYVPVEDIKKLKSGMLAVIISPLGKTTGDIEFISHSLDPDTKRVAVRVLSDNKNDVLKPNMYVDTEIKVKSIKGIFIPASAVAETEEGFFVFKKEGEIFKPVKVKIGKRVKGFYYIISGLKEGDEVVVEGTVHLKAKFFGEAEEE